MPNERTLTAAPASPPGAGRRDERGTTLTEILVILGLLGTLILISIPALVDLLRSFEVRGISSAMAQGFRQAQAMALADHRNIIIFVNPQEGTAPKFCGGEGWEAPGARRLYAIVEEGEDGEPANDRCRINDASCTGSRVRAWGPEIPRMVSYARANSGETIDIGGDGSSTFFKTLCFNSRGGVHRNVEPREGVFLGNVQKRIYRQVRVSRSGRVATLRYRGDAYVEQ